MTRTSFRPVLVVTAGSVLQMILQLAFQTLIARHFGMTGDVDAYEAAISLPLVVAAILGLPIGSVLIPLANQAQSLDGDRGAWTSVSKVGSTMLIVTLVIAGGLIAAARPLSALLFSDLGDAELTLAVRLMTILAWLIPANVVTAYCQAVHNWRGQFTISALAGVVGPGVTLGIIWYRGASLRIEDVAFAAVSGAAVNVLVQLPGLLPHLRWRPSFHLGGRAMRLFLPLLLGGIYLRIDPVVDRSLGSAFDEGTLACLGNSSRVINAALAVAVGGLSVVAFPRMARAAQQSSRALSHEMAEAFRALVTILVPLSIALGFFGDALIHDLFERGQFTPHDTARVALFVRCAMGVMIGGGLGEITSRVFYATHDMKTPTLIGVACFTAALAMKFGLSRILGPGGILLASSIAWCASAGVQTLFLASRLGSAVVEGVGRRLILSTLGAGMAAAAGAWVISLKPAFPGVYGGLAGLAVYIAAMTLLIRLDRPSTSTPSPVSDTEQPEVEEITEQQAGLNLP